MLKCMICGKETTQINAAHLRTHGLTSAQYREMFPDAKMRILSDACRKKASEIMTKRNQSEKGRQKSSEMFKGKSKTEEHKQALRDAKAKEDKELRAKINGDNRRGKLQPEGTLLKQTNNGTRSPFRGNSGHREDLGHYVRSNWEANIARVYKFLGVQYRFEEKSFVLTRENGSRTSYTPDFYIPQADTYVEVKGFWMDDAREKFELFGKQYPHVLIEVIDAKEYQEYVDSFKDKIKEWE